ncbi:MAG: response regulator transcription factor [Candidatus Dadabacteria bacterium]|nr:response regulator transcription factor [Candidatus Dadabacteria bacterium]
MKISGIEPFGTVVATYMQRKRMATVYKIALVSSSKLFLDGLRKIMEFEADMEVTTEVSEPEALIGIARDGAPDFIFVDNREREFDIDGLVASGGLKSKVILFTQSGGTEPDTGNILHVNFETTTSELINIIKNGGSKKPPARNTSPKDLEFRKITKTEFRIIQLVAAGESNRDIARKLGSSEKTVKAHITSIFEKLGLDNRYQLIVYGKRNMMDGDAEA